jgi:hypothetical protein
MYLYIIYDKAEKCRTDATEKIKKQKSFTFPDGFYHRTKSGKRIHIKYDVKKRQIVVHKKMRNELVGAEVFIFKIIQRKMRITTRENKTETHKCDDVDNE